MKVFKQPPQLRGVGWVEIGVGGTIARMARFISLIKPLLFEDISISFGCRKCCANQIGIEVPVWSRFPPWMRTRDWLSYR
jgi:hypothetical protein